MNFYHVHYLSYNTTRYVCEKHLELEEELHGLKAIVLCEHPLKKNGNSRHTCVICKAQLEDESVSIQTSTTNVCWPCAVSVCRNCTGCACKHQKPQK